MQDHVALAGRKQFEVSRDHGYSAVRHQRFVGAGYFDQVQQVIAGGYSSTAALAASTENAQFSSVPVNGAPHHGVQA
jgi:isocitrate lyase